MRFNGAPTRVLLCVVLLSLSSIASAESKALNIGGGTIEVTLPRGESAALQDNLMLWVRRAADAVTTYYGRFPVKHLTLRISADDRDGVHHGVTYPKDGGLIEISVGRGTS